MLKSTESGIRARSFQFSSGKLLVGLGAALVLAGPSTALAQGKLCPVTFSVSSNETIGALQITTDYSSATALGDLTSCTIAQAGTVDSLVDELGDSATMGYADTTGFTGPDLFATCYFKVTDENDPAPVAGDFLVNVDDASDTDVPPNPISPAIDVAVLDCVPSGSCPFEPSTGCRTPFVTGKSQLQLKDNADNSKDKGKFQWKAGSATTLLDFNDPLTAGETYSWCLYDDGALVRGSDVPSAGTCGTKPCWKATGTKGFQFKGDKEINGVAQIKLKEGVDGKAQVQVKAQSKLGNFVSPTLPLSTNVVSQLVIDDGVAPLCFEATFTAPKKNDAAQYKSKD